MHNLEDFNNLFKNMEILRSLRHKCISLIIILITEVYIYSKAFSRIQALNFYYLEYWCLPLLLIITWVVWLIDSQRLFFRDQWKILYWIVVFNIIAISFPLLICPHFNDNIPYV